MSNIIQLRITIALSCLLLAQPALAIENNWKIKTDLQGSYGNYNNSVLRKSTWSTGLFIAADYDRTMGFTAGYSRTQVNYKLGIQRLSQDSYFGSIRKYLMLDNKDKITFRIDGHLINNNDPTNGTDEGGIVAPQISYLTADKSLYLDLGYAHSSYGGDLTLDQWTPTLGIGFNQNSDWIQLRGYLIYSSNASRTQGKQDTYSVEAKLIHYFSPNPINISRLQLIGLAGQRMYAVDSDAGSVYNLADIQKGSVALSSLWDLSQSWSAQLIGGWEFYENKNINDKYSNRYIYFNVSKNW
jgi:hypothetical protein